MTPWQRESHVTVEETVSVLEFPSPSESSSPAGHVRPTMDPGISLLSLVM